jgi:GntR family transcriptional regulator
MSVPIHHPRATGGSARGRHTFSRRVRELLRASVRGGYIVVAEQLVEDSLVETLNASRNAVRAALQQLADEGFVDRQPRRGTVVLRRGTPIRMQDIDVLDGGTHVELEMTEESVVPSTPLLRHRLDLDETHLGMNENLFLLDGEVIGIRTAYFSIRHRKPTYTGPAEMPAVFTGYFGVPLGRVQTEIGATTADERTGRLLGLPAGTPLLLREQLMHDDQGRPVQLVFDNYRSDRVTFRDHGAVPRGGATPVPAPRTAL